MKIAIDGFIALGQLWAGDSEELAKLYEDVEITQEGQTVRLEWQGDSEDVVAALTVLRDRIAQWSGRERRRQ